VRYRSLTTETAPAVEPVSVSEAKEHLRVDISDDDTYIGSLITAARKYCEEYLDRALVSQQLTMRMDTFPYEFELPRPRRRRQRSQRRAIVSIGMPRLAASAPSTTAPGLAT
jgi:hypothetical protein